MCHSIQIKVLGCFVNDIVLQTHGHLDNKFHPSLCAGFGAIWGHHIGLSTFHEMILSCCGVEVVLPYHDSSATQLTWLV